MKCTGCTARLLVLFCVVALSGGIWATPEIEDDDDGVEEIMPPAPEVEQERSTTPAPKWKAPDYTEQTKSLGWAADVFVVPPEMEQRVQFWRDIYSKYTADQGVLHDSVYIDIIYENLDFSEITSRTDLTDREKERLRRRLVTERKNDITSRLKRLQEAKDPAALTGEDLRVWNLFAKVDEPKKFHEATRRKRLRFQLGQRSQFMSGVHQSGRYLRQMEEIFRQESLPIELTRLPFVESSFNLKARSRVGASGIWQFMRSTAKVYMRMDASADERNDPLRATRAAAKKLRDNYQMLKSWPLAITAYNHGPSGVKRLTEKMGTTNIVDLIDVRKGRFGFASSNFYANFLAAMEVERRADQYFGAVDVLPELRGAEIRLLKSQTSVDLLKWFGQDLELAKLLNPHVTPKVWDGKMALTPRHYVRVPLLQEREARAALE